MESSSPTQMLVRHVDSSVGGSRRIDQERFGRRYINALDGVRFQHQIPVGQRHVCGIAQTFSLHDNVGHERPPRIAIFRIPIRVVVRVDFDPYVGTVVHCGVHVDCRYGKPSFFGFDVEHVARQQILTVKCGGGGMGDDVGDGRRVGGSGGRFARDRRRRSGRTVRWPIRDGRGQGLRGVVFQTSCHDERVFLLRGFQISRFDLDAIAIARSGIRYANPFGVVDGIFAIDRAVGKIHPIVVRAVHQSQIQIVEHALVAVGPGRRVGPYQGDREFVSSAVGRYVEIVLVHFFVFERLSVVKVSS